MSVFEISPLEHGAGLKLSGELDLATARQLREALRNDVPQEGELSLDLSELEFVDSSGVATILAYAGERNGNGPVLLINATKAVARVFELLKLDQHPCIEVRGAV
jgi:anti-sigma B factor antagonist